MYLTPTEKDRVTDLVLRSYRGAKQVRISATSVEVKVVLQYAPGGAVALTGWFFAGTPDYWLTRVQTMRNLERAGIEPADQVLPLYPPM